MSPKTQESIHRLWDRLADQPASAPERALNLLLENVCRLIGAQRGYCLGAVRMSRAAHGDPAHGWRPVFVHHPDAGPSDRAAFRRGRRDIEQGDVSESTAALTEGAGRFRAYLLRDLVPADFYRSRHFRVQCRARGIADTLFVVCPVNRDVEAYYGFHRLDAHKPFSPGALEVPRYALRGLRWFHRRFMLSRGLVAAERPLTPTERRILNLLLTDRTEKQIACELSQQPPTTHQYITALYRKFNVHNRAGLLALWLGRR